MEVPERRTQQPDKKAGTVVNVSNLSTTEGKTGASLCPKHTCVMATEGGKISPSHCLTAGALSDFEH